MFDGYADVPVMNKRSRNDRKNLRKSEVFVDLPMIPPGPPRSTVSSGCSNSFTVSELRVSNSAPSTNTSDQSRITLATDRSSCHLQTPSPGQLKVSPGQLHGIKTQQQQQHHKWSSEMQMSGAQSADLMRSQLRRHVTPSSANEQNLNSNKFKKERTQLEKATHQRDTTHPSCSTQVRNRTHAMMHCDKQGHFSNDNNIADASNSSCKIVTTATVAESKSDDDSSSVNETLSELIAERTVPIKVTPEAQKILEQNAQMFGKGEPNGGLTEQNDELRNMDHMKASKQCSVDSISPTPNHSSQSISTAYVPLNRNAEYGSTISSLTQSTNMKTDASDIDFSWVNDVENRLDKEIALVKEGLPRQQQQQQQQPQQQQQQQMPVRYFGMGSISESSVNRRLASQRVFKEPITKALEVFGECDSRKELSQIHSDVKSKAAMFDNEACQHERKFGEQTPCRYRSRSTPRTNVYIQQSDHRSYDPLSVDTSQSNSNRYFDAQPINNNKNNVVRITDHQRQRVHNADNDKCMISSNMNSAGERRHKQQCFWNNNASNGNKSPNADVDYNNKILQRNRTYNATEYYIQNAGRRNVEKPWRASVAY